MRKCQNTQSFNAQKRPWPLSVHRSVEVPGISGGDGIAAGMTPPVKAEDNWMNVFCLDGKSRKPKNCNPLLEVWNWYKICNNKLLQL